MSRAAPGSPPSGCASTRRSCSRSASSPSSPCSRPRTGSSITNAARSAPILRLALSAGLSRPRGGAGAAALFRRAGRLAAGDAGALFVDRARHNARPARLSARARLSRRLHQPRPRPERILDRGPCRRRNAARRPAARRRRRDARPPRLQAAIRIARPARARGLRALARFLDCCGDRDLGLRRDVSCLRRRRLGRLSREPHFHPHGRAGRRRHRLPQDPEPVRRRAAVGRPGCAGVCGTGDRRVDGGIRRPTRSITTSWSWARRSPSSPRTD